MSQKPVKQLLLEIRRVAGGATPVHVHLRERLVAITLLSAMVDVLATVAIFFMEHNVRGTGIHTMFDSWFWTTTQLLTVSSQLPNPLSSGARVLDVFLQAYAISVVAALAGSMGSFFNLRSIQRHREKTGSPEIA